MESLLILGKPGGSELGGVMLPRDTLILTSSRVTMRLLYLSRVHKLEM